METSGRLAPCGIDCSTCDIFQAARDPAFAQRLAETLSAGGASHAEASWFQCKGCWGDRSVCWSDDCAIYRCCVEERHLASCSECADFPCTELQTWAGEYTNHRAAYARLKELRSQGSSE